MDSLNCVYLVLYEQTGQKTKRVSRRPRRAVQSAGYHVPGLVVAEHSPRGEIGVAAFERLDEFTRVSVLGVGDVYDLNLAAVIRRRQRRALAVDGQVVDLLGVGVGKRVEQNL